MATARKAKIRDNLLSPSFFAKSSTKVPNRVPTIANGMKWTYWIERMPTSDAKNPTKEKPEKDSLSTTSSDSGRNCDSCVAIEFGIKKITLNRTSDLRYPWYANPRASVRPESLPPRVLFTPLAVETLSLLIRKD
jgi:hypothetical protein